MIELPAWAVMALWALALAAAIRRRRRAS